MILPIIQKPIEKGTVVTFRLTTGEILMATMGDKSDTHLLVTRPLVANPTQNENGFGLYFTPFIATADEENLHRIPRAAVLLEPMLPRDELRVSYVKMTSQLEIPR